MGAALAASKKKALKQERAHLKLNKSQNLPVTPSPSTTDSRRGMGLIHTNEGKIMFLNSVKKISIIYFVEFHETFEC